MSTLWNKALLYLGLVDEDEVEQASGGAGVPQAQVRTVEAQGSPRGGIPGRRVEPPVGARRQMASDPVQAEAGVRVRSTRGAGGRVTAGEGQCDVVVARQFNDAQLVADGIRERVPVVLDLRETDPDMVRRLVDFASGLTYALEGTMRKVAQGVILVLPARTTLARDERRRLAGLGLYELPPDEEPSA